MAAPRLDHCRLSEGECSVFSAVQTPEILDKNGAGAYCYMCFAFLTKLISCQVYRLGNLLSAQVFFAPKDPADFLVHSGFYSPAF